MQPVFAIVGRPNVGKSTLFNQLTRSRDALVADVPGLTRDRVAGLGRAGTRPFIVFDTGGLGNDEDLLQEQVAAQAYRAAAEADRILFVVDARAGLTGADRDIAERLRALGHPVIVVVNKAEGHDADVACADFHALGLGAPVAVSAAHRVGLDHLVERAFEGLPPETEPEGDVGGSRPIKVTVIGRPNVGKSTLVNRMLGEQRVLVADLPGTTRDRIAIPFERDGVQYVLYDTAGVRRRARVVETIEKLSIVKALEGLAEAEVAILVLDAHEGVTEQDASLLGLALERGCGLLLAINKWDGLSDQDRTRVQSELDRRLDFVDYAPRHYISALHGSGVGNLFPAIRTVHASAFIEASPSAITAILEHAVSAHQPPLVKGRRVKLRYAHLGGSNPPRVIIHGSQVNELPTSYRRYLERVYREALRLTGTPVRIEFRQGKNPYAGKRNPLTTRQVAKRRRLMKHVKK